MVPFRTILHPTDFSVHSEYAFQVACGLTRICGARLIVVHVMAPLLDRERLDARHHPNEYYAGPWKELRKMQPSNDGPLVEHQLAEGDACTEILRVAGETKSDLIVMGTHGRTGLSRLVIGSVAEQVVRRAACPVMAAKFQAQENVHSEEPAGDIEAAVEG
jgi:nucleotide-binding universal stress UspA family protein